MAKEPPIRDLPPYLINADLIGDYQYEQYTPSVLVSAPKLDNYNVFYTVLSNYNGFIPLEGGVYKRAGYFIETSDDSSIFDVGDTVKIGSTNYEVLDVTKPQINSNTGKLLSFQDISSDPIVVDPSTSRTYTFFISINISETL